MYDYLAIILTIHEMVCIGISFFVILFLYTQYVTGVRIYALVL